MAAVPSYASTAAEVRRRRLCVGYRWPWPWPWVDCRLWKMRERCSQGSGAVGRVEAAFAKPPAANQPGRWRVDEHTLGRFAAFLASEACNVPHPTACSNRMLARCSINLVLTTTRPLSGTGLHVTCDGRNGWLDRGSCVRVQAGHQFNPPNCPLFALEPTARQLPTL